MIDDLWYKNTTIYSLDLETFMDANGDGVGDFVEFMQQAKKRGIHVIIDLVVNHTSDQHRWFQAARADQNSPYRDWYMWSKKRPANWNQGMVFPGVQQATWTYDKAARAYYFHRFYDFQPDLNMDHPEVRTELRRIMGYWLELGIAGFRVDAVPFLIETPAMGKKKAEQKFAYLSEMRHFLQWRRGDAILLGGDQTQVLLVPRHMTRTIPPACMPYLICDVPESPQSASPMEPLPGAAPVRYG